MTEHYYVEVGPITYFVTRENGHGWSISRRIADTEDFYITGSRDDVSNYIRECALKLGQSIINAELK